MPWTHPEYEAVIRLLGERAGLSFPEARHDSAEDGIRKAMARAGIAETRRYCDWIAGNSAALDDLIVELTVGETYFFREAPHFDFIRDEVLPQAKHRRGPGDKVRIWSAGCASGEEAYSLAMLLERQGLAEQAFLVATDISRSALSRARSGEYGSWSFRGDGAAQTQGFLLPNGNRQRVVDAIKNRVTFEYFNLALDTYPSIASGIWGMDLILCRNVMIYFDPATIRAVARRFYETLVVGGWLVTASSDPPLAELAPLEMVICDQGIFYQRKASSAVAPIHSTPPLMGPIREPSPPPPPAPHRPAARLAPPSVRPVRPSVSSPPAVSELLVRARTAFANGEYARAAELTAGLQDQAEAMVLRVRALANVDPTRALEACASAVARHSLSVELQFLHVVLLFELGKGEEAVQAVRRVLYLDRDLAIGHFTLGTILARQGDASGARRAYRNARNLCVSRPEDEELPLADGERAGRLAEIASAHIDILDASQEATR